MTERETLLAMLPPYRDQWVMINPDQDVKDIVRDICEKHDQFASHYDLIALYFDAPTVRGICDNLQTFCENNITYVEENEMVGDSPVQTTAIPGGILTRGYGDCKHYASFCGGVLDAISRLTGKKIKWSYRFASYRIDRPTPYHVFVVVQDGGNEIWIDPTPGARSMQPVWVVDKSVAGIMPLYSNIAGVNDDAVAQVSANEQLAEALQDVDLSSDVPDENQQAILYLLQIGVLNPDGSFNNQRLDILLNTDEQTKNAVLDAYNVAVSSDPSATVSGVGDWIAFQTAMVSMAVPRAAFLGLVALNAFGYATKLKRALVDDDARAKLFDKWHRLGGKQDGLTSAIESGAKKKALLKISKGKFVSGKQMVNGNAVGVAPVVAAAAIAAAGSVIVAIMPLVTKLAGNKNDGIPLDANGYPIGVDTSGMATTGFLGLDTTTWLMIGAAAALLGWYYYNE